MNRRELISLVGSAARPLTARAHQGENVRPVGVLLPAVADDPEWQARVGAFQQALTLVIFLGCFLLIYRIINSPFGEVLKAIRENEPRAISLG